MVESLLSPMLRAGDRVRLLSPASFPQSDGGSPVDEAVDILESWGLVAEVGKHALDHWGYMAGRDADRLADLNEAFADPGVRAIITTRGGAGAYRIAENIDFDAVRADPKPIVGFSDITNIHMALWSHCRMSSIHGCIAGEKAVESTRQLLMSKQSITLLSDAAALSARINVTGVATGPVVGGHLDTVAGYVGVGSLNLVGAILFLEYPRTQGLGRVDRSLTQLRASGSLDGIAGIALGLFTGYDDYYDRNWHVVDVLNDRLCDLGVPVLGGLQVGHFGKPDANGMADQFSIPLGTPATLDADAGTLTISPLVY